jgi:hypothetical protein
MPDAQLHAQVLLPLLSDRPVRLALMLLAVAGSAAAQITLAPVSPSPGKLSLCNSGQFAVAKQLTFVQRACWYGSELVSPWAAVRAGFSSGLSQWWNDPYVKGQDGDDYAHRFAVYYVKRSARDTGELIAGYLNHEDPRFHPSGERAAKKRIRSALLSVLVTRGDEGNRPALAPIAGSLGSAFAGAACYREHTGAEYALRGAGVTYASYFGKALYQEFRPDISLFVSRMLHRPPN